MLFEGLTLSLSMGQAMAIIGANGCGKSTLLAGLSGLLPLTEGTIQLTFESGETLEGGKAISDFCHHLGHHNAMKQDLTVEDNLRFWQQFSGNQSAITIDDALIALKLEHTKSMPFGFLSTGQRRRIAIARLMVSHRPLWLLDEPTSGLDAGSVTLFESLMADHLAKGGIIIAATHLPLGKQKDWQEDWQTIDLTTYAPAGDPS